MTNRDAAIKVVKRLNGAGYQALFAGGCVRDMLLGKRPKDYDIATNASPQNVCDLFRRTVEVGAKFGVIIVMIESHQIEVATFRTESHYTDGRRPDTVKFSTAKEDAARRDFTINGMFYDPIKKKVIDYVKGAADIEKGLIRTIGKAEERFSEDYLRMLRAIRFSTRLNFKISPVAVGAIKNNCRKIINVSGERIAAELQGLLACSNRADGFDKLIQTGLGVVIFNVFKDKKISSYGSKVCGNLPKMANFCLAMAAIFSGTETSLAMENIKPLKLSTNQLRHIVFLLNHRTVLLDKDMSLAKLKMLLAKPYFEDLYQLQLAIQKTENQSKSPLMILRKRANKLIGTELSPKPLLDGREIMALGIKSGPQIGKVSRALYAQQLSENIKTSVQAKKWIAGWLKENKTKG